MFEFWVIDAVCSTLLSYYHFFTIYSAISHQPWRSNLEKIGIRYDLLGESREKGFNFNRHALIYFLFVVPINSVLLSWLQFGATIYLIIRSKSSASMLAHPPDSIKELSWKVRNTILSREEAIETMRALCLKVNDTQRLEYINSLSDAEESDENESREEAVKTTELDTRSGPEKDLFDGALHNDIEKVKAAILAGAPVDGSRPEKGTAFLTAAANGYIEVAKFLISKGADVRAIGPGGNSALHMAALVGRVPAIELLLDLGLDLEAKDQDQEVTPIFDATFTGQVPAAKLLLERGARLDARDNEAHTPLWIASSLGRLDLVKLFIEKGADPNAEDNKGQPPFVMAAAHGHGQVVNLLLNHSPKVHRKDRWGLTALHHAARHGLVSTVRTLIRMGADVNAKADDGFTPLHFAIGNAQFKTRQLLLENGADPHINANDGRKPLDLEAFGKTVHDLKNRIRLIRMTPKEVSVADLNDQIRILEESEPNPETNQLVAELMRKWSQSPSSEAHRKIQRKIADALEKDLAEEYGHVEEDDTSFDDAA